MSNAEVEQAYHEGFLDGIQLMIDAWDDAVEKSLGRTEAYEAFSEVVEDQRSEIESR